jgi:hypothetical protein
MSVEEIIGGDPRVVYSRALQGQEARSPALLPDLAYSVLLPYLGDEQGRRESGRPLTAATSADARQ